eukprot:365941-Chlamydomonas_euryale.AAC.3
MTARHNGGLVHGAGAGRAHRDDGVARFVERGAFDAVGGATRGLALDAHADLRGRSRAGVGVSGGACVCGALDAHADLSGGVRAGVGGAEGGGGVRPCCCDFFPTNVVASE